MELAFVLFLLFIGFLLGVFFILLVTNIVVYRIAKEVKKFAQTDEYDGDDDDEDRWLGDANWWKK
jgi:hypothetical protein